jgi:cysteine desulfurase
MGSTSLLVYTLPASEKFPGAGLTASFCDPYPGVKGPVMRAYLDNNATTPVDPAVLEAMLPYLGSVFGNAGSVHSVGQAARGAVDAARESLARFVGAKSSEIVFTSGGTEADNLAIFGVVAASARAKKHVITSTIEHPAVLQSCEALATPGASITFVPVGSSGVVDPDEVRRALRPETILISVMYANNETGAIQPVEEIGRIAREAAVAFHCDAVQAAGKLPLDVNALGVDLLSISAHKFYGPKGVGALFVRKSTALEPLFRGGHAERDRRPGTENIPGIVGIGKATQLAGESLASGVSRIAALRDRFEGELLARVPGSAVNGDSKRRVGNTSNLRFPGAAGEALLIALDLQGIACSAGAACSSGSTEPSHVLKAMGLSDDEARSSLRFSFGRQTTEAEIDYALTVIPAVVERIRALSPRFSEAKPAVPVR